MRKLKTFKIVSTLSFITVPVFSLVNTVSVEAKNNNIFMSSKSKSVFDTIKQCYRGNKSIDYTCTGAAYDELEGWYTGPKKRFINSEIQVENYRKINSNTTLLRQRDLNSKYEIYKNLKKNTVDGTCVNVAAVQLAHIYNRSSIYNSWSSGHYSYGHNSGYLYPYTRQKFNVNPQTLFNEVFDQALQKKYTTLNKGTLYWSIFGNNVAKITDLALKGIDYDNYKLVTTTSKIKEKIGNKGYKPMIFNLSTHATVLLGYVDVKVDWQEGKTVRSGWFWSRVRTEWTNKVTWERYYVLATGWGNLGLYSKRHDIERIVEVIE